MRLRAVLLMGLGLWAPQHLNAQQPVNSRLATIVGNVVEESDSAIVGATVELVGLGLAKTDSGGIFRFRSVPLGSLILRTTRLGYAPAMQLVSAKANDTLIITVVLQRSAQALPPVEVKADSVVTFRTDPSGFLWRRKTGMGYYLDAIDIEKQNAPDVEHLVQVIPGLRVIKGGISIARESQSFLNPCYGAQILLNGVAMGFGFDLNTLPVSAVRGVEVYKGVAAIPAELRTTRNTCGIVAIWTR